MTTVTIDATSILEILINEAKFIALGTMGWFLYELVTTHFQP